jgi:hypothetical protein
MALSLRRALAVAVLTAAAGAGRLAAQGTPASASPPPVTVGGVSYTQFVYQLADTANHVNRFDITRAYVNVIGKFGGGLYTRVTADIFTNADSSRAYRLKYAYVAYTPAKSPLTFKIGEIHTPWLDWEEALWDYRVQGQMAMERAGYVSSSDFGAGIDGKWGPDKVNSQVTFVNGENYNKGTGDQRKDVMGRLSVRLLGSNDSSRVGGLRVTAYGEYGAPTSGGERQRWLGMVSYHSKQLTLAAEAAITRDSTTGTAGPPVVAAATRKNGHVYSAFGVCKITQAKVAILGRVDIFHPQSGNTTDKQTRIIAGVSYQIHPNWRLLADWDQVSFQTDPLNTANGPTRSQALFQTQFTF